ncbi:hypothetical protein EV714DRAFT_274014 [Schizophyllum commune]
MSSHLALPGHHHDHPNCATVALLQIGSTQAAAPAAEVQVLQVSVNKRDEAPIRRLQMFEGKLVFDMDYNPDAIPREVAEEWTQPWVDTTALTAQ